MVQSECMGVIQERSVSVSFGSPLPSHPLLSYNTAVHCSTSLHNTHCFSVLYVHRVLSCAVPLLCCSVLLHTLYKCTNCHALCTLLCSALCSPCVWLVGSDAPLPHLPSLDTKESALPKWGSFSPLQLSPPTTIVIVFEIQFSQSWAEKLAASQLDANAVTSFWAQCEFHLDMIWPSSEVSSESSTPVMSS